MIKFGDTNSLLKEVMPEFNFKNPVIDPVELAELLVKEMNKGEGIGLAANQIGIRARVFAMSSNPNYVCFNPKITFTWDEQIKMEEGCLSYPGAIIEVLRPKVIRTSFQDINGDIVTKKFDGMTARVFQHELDHLNGVLFYERVNRIRRERFQNKWKKIKRQLKKELQ